MKLFPFIIRIPIIIIIQTVGKIMPQQKERPFEKSKKPLALKKRDGLFKKKLKNLIFKLINYYVPLMNYNHFQLLFLLFLKKYKTLKKA